MPDPRSDLPALRTVSVPEPIAPLFRKAEAYVRRYFADRTEDPEHSSIVISGERYILVRAASMSVEFFDLVTSLYADRGAAEAASVAKNLLYDLAHSLGKADARAFAAKMGVTDPIEKLSAGPIHFSFAGWAFVKIYPESRPTPDTDYYLLYDHPFSFESDAWLRIGRSADFGVCVMNAGYSSGWCSESFGLPLVAAEVECRARGDAQCRFIMAPPDRIEAHLAQYVAAHGTAERSHRATGSTAVTVPVYFQRKRMEEALRSANELLERRVAERTGELAAANVALQAEIVERELAEEERRKVQAQLLHGQKLESLGVLSGGIAHDFNNLLVGILGNAGLALQDLPADSPVRETILDIEIAATRAAELTRQLLAYAGKAEFVVRAVNLSELVREMSHLLAAAVAKNARLDYRCERDLPWIEADATQLRQVVMNLITNASEAIGAEHGAIVVTTGTMEVDRAYLTESQLGADLAPGCYVFVEVQDDGQGMHPATQARIFDPFFTTKFTGRGLGLAAVLGIIRAHRGAIRLTSTPERGTTIRVLLPCGEEPANLPGAAPEAAAADTSLTGTVLVVDDEPSVRAVARRILESQGFTVRVAAGGIEALQILRGDPSAVDIVLLDMTMPDMSGTITLAELLRIRPGLPVLLSSGYVQDDTGSDTPAAGFIQKPYRPSDLVSAVRRALG
jgi:signal transduction histidine kinase